MNPPKPSALRRIEGNPGKRPFNRLEPEPRPGQVRCPARLSPEARKVWRELAPELRAMRLLTGADQRALATLCEDIAMDSFISTKLTASTLIVKLEGAKLAHINPLFYQQAELRKRIMGGFREFGLTPSSRSRIMVVKADVKKNDPVLDGDWRPKSVAGHLDKTVQ